jgi:hypothetical protein
MANVDATTLNKRVSGLERNRPAPHSGGPIQVASDSAAADANIGDIFRFLRLPVGSTIYDAWLAISAAAGIGVTANFGWLSVAGVAAVDDDNFFGTALDLNTGFFYRSAQSTGLIVLNDDVFVTATIAGANFGTAKTLRATVFYTLPG